jgi:putative DNA primase/helicase
VTAEDIARALEGRKSGNGWMVRCVAHEDRNPSMSITPGDDGRPLVHCFAGCSQDAVVGALRAQGLWPESTSQSTLMRESKASWPVITATYGYADERGNLLYQVVRREPGRDGRKKDFLQRYPDGADGWIWKKHSQQVLYRLPEVSEAPIVFVVEGERDVETLRGYGFVATCEAGGAKAPWLPQYTEALRGREVILVPDSDAPGRQRGARIARALLGSVAKLTLLELDDAKDITEWFERGHSEVELIAVVEEVIHAG